MKIKSIKARPVKDSRDMFTVEAIINGHGAICPSGASRGRHEAKTIDAKKAVANINRIGKALAGKDLMQEEFDNILIKLAGKNKAKLGANATTPLSMAFCRTTAEDLYNQLGAFYGNVNFSIPVPMMNVINGGAHVKDKKNKLAIQEFMIIPKTSDFKHSFNICNEIYAKLKALMYEFYGEAVLGDEAGFSPPIKNTEHALNLLGEAAKRTGLEDKIKFGIDAAASNFYKNGKYHIDGKKLTAKELHKFYIEMTEKYPLISIEDPFHEEDWKSFAELTKALGNKIMIVGDDLTATNPGRIKKAIKLKACNAIIIKVNQIGTVTEALEAAKLAKEHEMKIIVSHRSGESEDPFIADLAVGIGAEFIKAGAPFTKFRLAKYHRLIDIEDKKGFDYKSI